MMNYAEDEIFVQVTNLIEDQFDQESPTLYDHDPDLKRLIINS